MKRTSSGSMTTQMTGFGRQDLKAVCRLAAIAFVAVPAVGITPASASTLSLDLPGDPQRTTVSYTCRASESAAPTEMVVEYINLPGNTLALLPLDGKPTLFVSVAAGSGAQYVSGRTIWWTKGPGARLYDAVTKDFKAGSICEVKR